MHSESHSRFAGPTPQIVTARPFEPRKTAEIIFTLDEYLQYGIMTAAQHACLVTAVRDRRNILISGATGSGKTTLTNALIHTMVALAPQERIVLIEDTGELRCSAKNAVKYHPTTDASITRLLSTTLRMRPDRILVGEVRGAEARDLLTAWSTGHMGAAATIHATSATGALNRMAMLAGMYHEAPRHIETIIAKAVHVVVQMARTPGHKYRVAEMLQVNGYSGGQYRTEPV